MEIEAKIVANSNAGETEKRYHNVKCLIPQPANTDRKNPFVRVITSRILCPLVGAEIHVRKDCLSYPK